MTTSTLMTEKIKSNEGDVDAPFFINRDGTWLYRGSPVHRKSLVKLFASILVREKDGSFWLVTPVERVAVSVADAPFVIVNANRIGTGPRQILRLQTNIGEELTVGIEHPIYVKTNPETGEPSPYVKLSHGLTGLIARPVFYDLVLWSEQDWNSGECFVRSANQKFILGQIDNDHELNHA
ncbi:MAG: proteophosphoglycan precursor [Rhodospirillaceae bacterium]|nr:proteophosphoglycan precursor [Rhodospirillaceae bacterium]